MKLRGFAPRFHKCPRCRQSALRWFMTKFAVSHTNGIRCTSCGWTGTRTDVVRAA